jgi:hypothetical protein
MMISVPHYPALSRASPAVGQAWPTIRGAFIWLYQRLCGLRGHELVRVFEPGRAALRCLDCGLQTAGWRCDPHAAVRPVPPLRARRVGGRGRV